MPSILFNKWIKEAKQVLQEQAKFMVQALTH